MDGVIGPINDRLARLEAMLYQHQAVLAPQLAEKAKAEADAAQAIRDAEIADAEQRRASYEAWAAKHAEERDAIMQQAKEQASEQWKADQLAQAKAQYLAQIAAQEKAQAAAEAEFNAKAAQEADAKAAALAAYTARFGPPAS